MSEVLELKEFLIQTCDEVLTKYNINFSFIQEKSENTLNSGEQINLLVGLTKGMKGNFVLGMSKKAACHIITGMTGQEDLFTLDNVSRNALSEFITTICKQTLAKLPTKKMISISSTTLVAGERICLMISRTPAKKCFFKMNDTNFTIAYNIEGEL